MQNLFVVARHWQKTFNPPRAQHQADRVGLPHAVSCRPCRDLQPTFGPDFCSATALYESRSTTTTTSTDALRLTRRTTKLGKMGKVKSDTSKRARHDPLTIQLREDERGGGKLSAPGRRAGKRKEDAQEVRRLTDEGYGM